MGMLSFNLLLGVVLAILSVSLVNADDPYRFYTWTVTYGTTSPLGVPQRVILINGQFPGPRLDVVTNDNLVLNLINKLDVPFLLTWNGIKQRKNSWQDGVVGTNCPILPGANYTYIFQPKDQIGSFTYFPSTGFHRAAGGYGAINVYSRPRIPVPYAIPDGDFTLLVGDWYKTDHKVLQDSLDSGKSLPLPDGVLINGQIQATFSGDQDVGQSVNVLVTLNQAPKDYYIVASTRFSPKKLLASGVLHYTNSQVPVSGPLPAEPSFQLHGSMEQARTYRWNLTANAARPNPQGSFHYGKITTTKTIVLSNSAPLINGKQRYAVNGVSYVNADTPLKLADYFNIPGVFSTTSLQTVPSGGAATVATSVVPTSLHDFIEVVFQNNENAMQSWHLDGYDFWVVGYASQSSILSRFLANLRKHCDDCS
ncbi:L-ascorbate oxidase homolog [Linum grandiflorum]